MIHVSHRTRCSGCSACQAMCPHGAITMRADGMGFRYPEVDTARCTDCGLCEKIDPFRACQKTTVPTAEAIRFPDLLDRSQSGGLGFALMRKAIREGWVVYGAAIDNDFTVRHRRVEFEADLEPLRLSKYVQSDMDGIPAAVKEDLRAGRRVLFTGTPCQCSGVGSVCAPWRENLLLADILCHGVPAPAVWQAYLSNEREETRQSLDGVRFRDPSLGWHIHKEALCLDGEWQIRDEWTFLFYRSLMLRPSCAHCPFTSLSRPSDLTMADCWGVEKALPHFADDNRGCSLLLVSTPTGEAFTRSFPDACERHEVDLAAVMQPNLSAPTPFHRKADAFERVFLRQGYKAAWKRFGRDSLSYRMEQFLQKIKRHL